MAKYIDTEKLIAEIERRKEEWLAISRIIKKGKDKAMYEAGKSSAYTEFLSLTTSLQQEQQEVDFETEYAKFSNDPDALDYAFPIDLADYKDFARHFFELGLNAKKEE